MIFFADTMSQGKKNDHVTHNSCLNISENFLMMRGVFNINRQSAMMLFILITAQINTNVGKFFGILLLVLKIMVAVSRIDLPKNMVSKEVGMPQVRKSRP